ncbi:PilW family protein [Massilia pseudoviolaceinigra]|uniref:PilW family protein n=1 Tax=Massilia pseudoviolaceinigra TaxID=3057165 RepID=UPI0027964A32|nr:PilW family protein [Massilia sp. CCM 9206]MDQ1920653.1 PilW family protein [Massilia sp. CCM 9206]
MTVRPSAPRNLGTSKQQGLGLVEVLVAMTVGLVLLGGVGYMFIGSKQMNTAQTDVVRIQESTRNALDVVGIALRQAGYRLNMNRMEIEGDAIQGTVGADSDILIVRHDPNWVVDPTVPPNRLLGRERNCVGVDITSDNAVNAATADPQVNNNLVIYQFRVVNRQLMCYASTSVAAPGVGVVVADNVERMKVTYGIGNRQEAVTNYVAAPPDFTNVSAVRITLLLRGPSGGVTVGPQTVSFNGADVTTNDGHLRRVVTATFNVRNRSRF